MIGDYFAGAEKEALKMNKQAVAADIQIQEQAKKIQK